VMSYRMNITRQNKSQLHLPFTIFIYLLFLGEDFIFRRKKERKSGEKNYEKNECGTKQ